MGENGNQTHAPVRLTPYMTPFGAWAFVIGTSIGWGSLVVTGSTYLAQAGPLGSVLGMLVGMGVMIVIAVCYHFMMSHNANAGGVYAYARDLFGYDHAMLVAWFLGLTYIAVFWANATSLPLFARYFMGGLFQFGPHYEVLGYNIYLGEALLSCAFIALAGFVCGMHKKGVSIAVIIMVIVIIAGLTVCFGGAVANYDSASFSFDPLFVPGSNELVQVLNIACISSWAFIGFESISHSAEEFNFSPKLSLRIFVSALVVVTVLYIFVTLLSITAYPPQYANWMDYIGDLGNNAGIAGIPAFYAAWTYLGDTGVAILMAVLLSLVFTSLICNIVAISRLLFCLARDNILPDSLFMVNGQGAPTSAIALVVIVSMVIPFLGRTAIGWIVDVTTLGATIVYGFVSACAIKDGRDRKNDIETGCGYVGLVFMVAFGAYLLLPNILSNGAMAMESYILFALWAMIGFLVFRRLMRKDGERRFGNSIIAWLFLLALVLFTALAWMGQVTDHATHATVDSVRSYYVENAGAPESAGEEDDAFAEEAAIGLDATIMGSMFLVSGMFGFSLFVMLSNFNIMRRREEESHQRATIAHAAANTDAMTGVKNKAAYVAHEYEFSQMLQAGELSDLAVVVCDVNGLKQVNDTLGHKAGDEYICSASKMICEFYKHSPVYRVGGDEFVVLVQGEDFANRDQILAAIDAQSVSNRDSGGVVVSVGMSVIDPAVDREVHAAFERADAAMYERKRELKGGVDVR